MHCCLPTCMLTDQALALRGRAVPEMSLGQMQAALSVVAVQCALAGSARHQLPLRAA